MYQPEIKIIIIIKSSKCVKTFTNRCGDDEKAASLHENFIEKDQVPKREQF